jgi:TM2 domain-containing membrane protein YozV
MMYCQNCGLFFPDEETSCKECGGPLAQTKKELPFDEGLQPPSEPPALPEVSPKQRNTVILLCYFAGIFGVHRFYLGKILSGIFMLLTLGGLTIWTCIDFVTAVTGTLRDSNGRYLEKYYNRTMVAILVIAPVILLIAVTVILFLVAYFWFKEGIDIAQIF